VPLHKVYLNSSLVSGIVTVGIRPTLPIQGITLLLGNDFAGGKVNVNPELQVVDEPKLQGMVETESTDIYPACVVTRSAARRARNNGEVVVSQSDDSRSQTERPVADENDMRIPEMTPNSPLLREQLIIDQKNDPELCQIASEALSSDEAPDVRTCYYDNDGILMRKWRPATARANEGWQIVHQIVVPRVHRREVLELGHALPMAALIRPIRRL